MYAASKGFVRLLTDSLSVELLAHGVSAADVLPGIIKTAMTSGGLALMAAPDGPWRLMPASAVAAKVWECYQAPVAARRIHYFVPDELEALDKAVAQNREAARDERLHSMRASGVANRFEGGSKL